MIPERYKFLTPILVALILLLGVQIGYFLKGTDQNKIFGGHNSHGVSDMDEVMGIVQNNYTDTVNINRMEAAGIDDMLKTLDPHSSYFPPIEAKAANDDLAGHFGGIGVEFAIIDDTVTLLKVLPGGPSAKAGLQVGDQIITVNKHPFTGPKIDFDTVTRYLRGDLNTSVSLQIHRYNSLINKELKRGIITTSSVYASYMMTPKAGYIGISSFTKDVSIDFVKALDSLKKQGMKELVIDLRGNGGGLLDEAVRICDELLDENKLIVYTKGRAYSRQDYKCKTQGDWEEGKVIILVDELTASASEIVAGCMQDWERAKIIGRRTFGKGLVQTSFSLSNGGMLRLTVARYYTPSGRCIQRSYAKGSAAYYHDISNRVLHNSAKADTTPEGADTTTYYTMVNHNPVYGGGGITPDIRIQGDTAHTPDKTLSFDALRHTAFKVYMRHKKANDLHYNSLHDLTGDKNLLSQLQNELKTYLTKKKVKTDNAYFTDYTNHILLAQYARWVFNENAYHALYNQTDAVYQKAMEKVK